MRDLEIRGAGNLLGAQQHGHMESVGYDLYCKLLDEAVKQEKGETVEEAFETSIEIDISAYIPSTYIKDEMQKLEIYKKIASIQTQQDFYDIQEEVEDRYGDLPKSVANLLEVSYLKAKAHEIGILSIVQKGSRLVITFKRDAKINPVLIPELLKRYRRKLSFAAGETPFFTYQLTDVNKNQLIRQIKNVLHDMKNLKL
jgi:transcription-repair coupling factor (superfamily II helicase)